MSDRILNLVGQANINYQQMTTLKKEHNGSLKKGSAGESCMMRDSSIFESIKLKQKPKLQKNTRPNNNAWVDINFSY